MARSRSHVWHGLLAGLLLGACGSVPASVDMFLRLGNLKGEATDKRHQDEIEVVSWSWGLSATPINAGGGAAVGKPAIQNLSLTKYIDASSPGLLTACATGRHWPNGVLTIRNVAGTTIDFYQIELEEVMISSIALGSSSGEDRLTEKLSLDFAKIRIVYFPTSQHRAETGTAFSWNIQAGTGDQGPVPSKGAAYITYLGSQLTFASGAPTTTLTWSSIVGVTYRVRFSNRPDGPYQAYGDYPSAGDGTTTIVLPASDVRSFFWVEQLTAP